MNFDLDDPLGSDDSFFEEPKALSKRPSIKSSEKKSVDNLFNLGEDIVKDADTSKDSRADTIIKPKSTVTFEDDTYPKLEKKSEDWLSDSFSTAQKKNEDWLGGSVSQKKSEDWLGDSDKASQKKSEDWLFDDTVKTSQKKPDDWLGESGHSSLQDKKSKKTDFLDDLLSVRSSSTKVEKKVSTFDDILKESKASTAPKPMQLTETTTPAEGNLYSLTNISRESRRSRRGSSTGVEDSLGLFEHQSGDFYNKNPKEVTKSAVEFQTKSAPRTSGKGIPDWLGGSSILAAPNQDTEVASKQEKTSEGNNIDDRNKELTKGTENVEVNKNVSITSEKSKLEDISSSLKQQQLHTELQNTYTSLQQQETFLLISLQLKKYEENLEDIKHQQQEILGKQEKQFNSLIDKYIVKQQMMENDIKMQQERINSHIKMLFAQPPNTPSAKSSNVEKENENSETQSETTKGLETIINSLKQRHSEELFIMEESYRKQIALLEKSTESIEQRLNDEIANITKMFDEKINNITKNYDEELEYYQQKIKTSEEQHRDEIKLIKEHHSQAMDDLKMEHLRQIEYLNEFKKHENDVLSNGQVYSQKLDASIEMLSSNTKALQGVQEKVYSSYDILSVARENSIQSKEKQIILMRNTLDKCREAAENERSQLLALIRSLETKIAEQNTNAQEDRWTLQQASATIAARSAALERETEYNRSIVEREREQLKTLKETLLAEQEKIILQLTEEKLLISSEKARIETESKLKNNYETEKIKAEAESAIQVAKDLTIKINQERDHLHRQRNELEILKANLTDREKEMESKEIELEYLVQNTQKRINQDRRVVSEARKMENRYKELLQELQNQRISLSNREKKLAEEKVLLSKERLALYTTMKQSKNCVLCKADDVPIYNEFNQINKDNSLNYKISDPDTIRFHLDVIDDERNSEVSKEENDFVSQKDME